MVKRFSTKAFILGALLHFAGTIALVDASFRVLRESKRTGIDVDPLWLTVLSWIWETLPMLISHASSFICILCLPGLFVLARFSDLLSHASSNGDAEPCNHAMELTASRRTILLSMTYILSPAALLALARSSSSYSR
jgi:hypothetical protein